MNQLLTGVMGVDEAWKAINHAQRITLLTHQRPDGDGISACAALESILEKKGKTVETVYPSEPETELARQPRNRLMNSHLQAPDLIIVLDTAVKSRVYWSELFNKLPLIIIDHHLDGDLVGNQTFMVPYAASTCELLYALLSAWDGTLVDQYAAECLMYGILYDTQVFQTTSVTPTTLRVTAELIEKGASLYQLKGEFLRPHEPAVVALWGSALEKMDTDSDKKTSWIVISAAMLKKAGLTEDAVGPLSNLFAGLCNSDITILFYELADGSVKASMRSKESNVNQVAKQLGGGGHRNASGCSSDKLSLDQFVEQVLSYL